MNEERALVLYQHPCRAAGLARVAQSEVRGLLEFECASEARISELEGENKTLRAQLAAQKK